MRTTITTCDFTGKRHAITSRLAILLISSLTLPVAALAAEDVSWSWGCDDATAYSTYVEAKSLKNTILSSSAITSDTVFDKETGSSDSTAKKDADYIKLSLPNDASAGAHYCTVTLPESVADERLDSFTLAFDYAPERNSANTQSAANYGLAVHDEDGNALVTMFGNNTSSFTIYKGADSGESLGTIPLTDITARGKSQVESKNANWVHIVLTGTTTGGVTIAITNMQTKAAVDLGDTPILSSTLRVPSAVLVMIGSYSSRHQWALLDDFSFSGKTIYKDKYTKSVDIDFEDAGDDSIVQNGYVDNEILQTSASTAESQNWEIVTGAASPKNGEKFLRAVAHSSSTSHTRKGFIVNLPLPITKARDYILEFDALIEQSKHNNDTNGVVIVGAKSTLATMWASTGNATITKGQTHEGEIVASGMALSNNTDTPNPVEYECVWYHFVVRGNSEIGVRLSVENLATGEGVVREALLGDFDNVKQIAFLLGSSNSARNNYACIDNIKAYTYRHGGFVISIASGNNEAEVNVESEALKTWLGDYTPDAVDELAKPNANGISPIAAYMLGYAGLYNRLAAEIAAAE